MRHFFAAAPLAACCAFTPAQAGVFLQYGGVLRNGVTSFGMMFMSGKLKQDIAFGQTHLVTKDDFDTLQITVDWRDPNLPTGYERVYSYNLPGSIQTFTATLRGWQETNVIFDGWGPIWKDALIETTFAMPAQNHQGITQSLRISSQFYNMNMLDQAGNRPYFASMAFVPEPASWLLMLAGFGFTGTSLRAASQRRGSYNRRCS